MHVIGRQQHGLAGPRHESSPDAQYSGDVSHRERIDDRRTGTIDSINLLGAISEIAKNRSQRSGKMT